jgi:hypothetical protein
MDYKNYKEKFHELYENTKELVDEEILDIGDRLDAVSNDEKEFYLYLLDFFLQKRQNEVISRGLF